jgi:molybdate/tungstate transport system ATP-binding protein
MSAGVCVEALTLTLGAFRLRKIDFAVSHGEVLVILGPNGSGKSVTLETIAGFHRPDAGRVLIGGCDLTALPPERRNIGFVVQNFGLFPHLNVAQNVAIARCRDRLMPAHNTALPAPADHAALLAYFGVAHLAQRAPATLSPGEKQRVALTRAIASAPDLFLFDEPFSALDAETRDQLREELKSFLRALAIPAIFVTHDRSEARTLADTMIVLRDGAIVQSGATAELLRKPRNSFVARFVGFENILSGRVVEISPDGPLIEAGGQLLRAGMPAEPMQTGKSIVLAIRAEDVTFGCSSSTPMPRAGVNRLKGRVHAVHDEGPLAVVSIDCGFLLKAYLLGPQLRAMKLSIGSAVAVNLAPEAVHIMAE